MPKFKKQRRTIEQFFDQGYCLARAPDHIINMLPDIRQYYQFKELSSFNPERADQPVPGSHANYADPLFETLLLKFLPCVQEWIGLELLPTYSYARIYRNGQELKPHVDRPPCEISVTFCIDYSYQHYQWPIYMDGVAINQQPGDVLIYRGIDLPHWRNKLTPYTPGHVYHMQSFFHYVNAKGPHAKEIFDRRPGLGLPSTTKKPPDTDLTPENQETSQPYQAINTMYQ